MKWFLLVASESICIARDLNSREMELGRPYQIIVKIWLTSRLTACKSAGDVNTISYSSDSYECIDKSSAYFCRGRSNQLSLIKLVRAHRHRNEMAWNTDRLNLFCDSDCSTVGIRCRRSIVLGRTTINDFSLSFDNATVATVRRDICISVMTARRVHHHCLESRKQISD